MQLRRKPVLFLDENMRSEAIIVPARSYDDWEIELYGDHFDQGRNDEELTAFCGPRGWSIVSADDDFRYNNECKSHIRQYRIHVFTMVLPRSIHVAKIGSGLVRAHDEILKIAKKDGACGLCAHIRLNGGVEVMTRFDLAGGLTEKQRRTMNKYGRV